MTDEAAATIPVESVQYIKEIYPRLSPSDETIDLYRASLDELPPITVAQSASAGSNVLVDGYHRWQAHQREGARFIAADDLGALSDFEILRESVRRNSRHGRQFTSKEKRANCDRLWSMWPQEDARKGGEKIDELAADLGVSKRSVEMWTKDARAAAQLQLQADAWDMWLDCEHTQDEIAEILAVPQRTVANWLSQTRNSADLAKPPGATDGKPWGSIQHFDVWQFGSDGGDSTYFSRMPPGIVENLLWFWTEPSGIVVDPFAGSGTTIKVAKRMGRRVWSSDRRGNYWDKTLPIHEHDIAAGWPADAPAKADLILLDPPYWQQARGKYSDDQEDLGNQSLDDFYKSWASIAKTAMEHTPRIAYIISPTQLEDGTVVDHATDMLAPFRDNGWQVERRIVVPYSTQQATGQQVTWAREKKRLLKLYRDLMVMSR